MFYRPARQVTAGLPCAPVSGRSWKRTARASSARSTRCWLVCGQEVSRPGSGVGRIQDGCSIVLLLRPPSRNCPACRSHFLPCDPRCLPGHGIVWWRTTGRGIPAVILHSARLPDRWVRPGRRSTRRLSTTRRAMAAGVSNCCTMQQLQYMGFGISVKGKPGESRLFRPKCSHIILMEKAALTDNHRGVTPVTTSVIVLRRSQSPSPQAASPASFRGTSGRSCRAGWA